MYFYCDQARKINKESWCAIPEFPPTIDAKKVSTSSRRIPKLFIKVFLVLPFSLFSNILTSHNFMTCTWWNPPEKICTSLNYCSKISIRTKCTGHIIPVYTNYTLFSPFAFLFPFPSWTTLLWSKKRRRRRALTHFRDGIPRESSTSLVAGGSNAKLRGTTKSKKTAFSYDLSLRCAPKGRQQQQQLSYMLTRCHTCAQFVSNSCMM